MIQINAAKAKAVFSFSPKRQQLGTSKTQCDTFFFTQLMINLALILPFNWEHLLGFFLSAISSQSPNFVMHWFFCQWQPVFKIKKSQFWILRSSAAINFHQQCKFKCICKRKCASIQTWIMSTRSNLWLTVWLHKWSKRANNKTKWVWQHQPSQVHQRITWISKTRNAIFRIITTFPSVIHVNFKTNRFSHWFIILVHYYVIWLQQMAFRYSVFKTTRALRPRMHQFIFQLGLNWERFH